MTDPPKTTKRVLVDDQTYDVKATRDGGMGRVWLLERAFDGPLDPVYARRIAVKTFFEESDAIEKELNIWISLTHPHILPLKKIGRLNYKLAAIMPLLDGSLADLLEERHPFGERETAQILGAVTEGLNFAWTSFGILHLDLKPSNLMISNRETLEIKIADWGISRLASDRHLRMTSARTRDE